MSLNKSQRIVRTLQQLEQFKLFASPSGDFAFHVLSGVQVTAITGSPDDERFISIRFPGCLDFEVDGIQYLKLQIAESAAHEIHLDEGNNNPIATRSNELLKIFSSTNNL